MKLTAYFFLNSSVISGIGAPVLAAVNGHWSIPCKQKQEEHIYIKSIIYM